MTTTEQFVRDLMAGHDPADGQTVPASERHAAAQRLQTAMTEGATLQRPDAEPLPRARLRRRRLTLVAVASVLAVVAGLLIVPGALTGDRSGRAYAATPPLLMDVGQPGDPAAQVLLALAEAGDRQPPLEADRFRHLRTATWYLHTSVSDGQGNSVIIPKITDRWLALDGSGVIAEATGQPVEAGPPGTLADERARRQLPAGDPVVSPFDPGTLHVLRPDRLPTAPDALRIALLEHDHTTLPEHVYLYRSLTDHLTQQRLQPALLAAYYRMLAQQPQMRSYGTVLDRAGREAIAVGFDTSVSGLPTRNLLLIDATSGTPLGIEQVLTTDPGKLGVQVPAVISYEALLAGGRVDNTKTRGPELP